MSERREMTRLEKLLNPMRRLRGTTVSYETVTETDTANYFYGWLRILAYGKHRWIITFDDGASTGWRTAWTVWDMRVAQWVAKYLWARRVAASRKAGDRR